MKFKRHKLPQLLFTVLLTSFLTYPLLATATADTASGKDIRGLWIDHKEPDKQKVAVWIEDCGAQLCGKIYWLRKPNFDSGEPKYDKHNPNESLQSRPLCGMKILTGFQYVGENTWKNGQVYNPSDGRTFSSSMTLKSDGMLRVRGFVGISLFGKTVEWVRPKDNYERCS